MFNRSICERQRLTLNFICAGSGYKRFAPNQAVGLKAIGFVLTYESHETDPAGNVTHIVVNCAPLADDNKPKVREAFEKCLALCVPPVPHVSHVPPFPLAYLNEGIHPLGVVGKCGPGADPGGSA